MTNRPKYVVNHLLTVSLQNGEVQDVEGAYARLSRLAKADKLWSQCMVLEVGPETLRLLDIESKEELESYPVQAVHRCEAIFNVKEYPSMLMLVCQSKDQQKPDILFFSSETVNRITDDIKGVVSASGKTQPPETLRPSQTADNMIDPYGIPSHPIAHAPNAPPANPPPYPGPRANDVNGGGDISFLRADREVRILNHCFEDMESFMSKLQQAAEAASILHQRKKKKSKKSKKQSAEDDLLTAKARPPPTEEFVDIFQKFKYCFCLLARLKSAIANPSSQELVHHLFRPLDMVVRTTGGPTLGASVSSPALTSSAVSLLWDNLNENEMQLWKSLGPSWVLPRCEQQAPVAPYSPAFYGGWQAEASRADGQAWEDPVESEHRHEALLRQEKQQPPVLRPSTPMGDETDGDTLPGASDRLYRCSYDFVARNSSELSVQQGDTLEVIESTKRWWKCRNRFNEVGFLPFNILEPAEHEEGPVASPPPPRAPAPPPLSLAKAFPAAAHSPPTAHRSPGQRVRTLPPYSPLLGGGEDSERVMQVNDELLQRLTNGKTNLNKPSLVIPRSTETSAPLDYHSPPDEVASWLRGKGFTEPAVQCLGVLTGAQLFSLNKEELRAVIPDEGARVYSQLTVQKALLEDERKATELEAVMEKQKMKVDLKSQASTTTL